MQIVANTYIQASPDLPSFMDCDLSSYDLNKRPKPLTNSQGHISIPQARLFNVIYQGIVGTDQSDVSAHLSMAKHMDDPPYLVMSDFYSSFVRSGLIRISKGYLSHFSGTAATITPSIAGIGEMGNEDAVDLGLAAEQGKINLDIAAVVLATGFTATPSLSFLPDSVLSTLSHSPQHSLTIPLILDFHNTLHAALPTLGFVGFYRSPYWGVMEQQARLLATLWAHDSRELARPASLTRALQQDDSAARMRALRTDERCSQFPMGDYSFLMNAFAEALDMSISPLFPPTSDSVAGVSGFDPKGPPQTDVLTPSRYTFPNATVDERRQTERSLCYTRQTLEAALTTPRFVARAMFRGLHGPWNIERRIDSRMRHLQPPGSFRGTGEFLLRGGSRDGREAATDRLLDRQRQEQQACGGDGQDGPEPVGWGTVTEYLYDEKGSFESDDGRLCFPATQRYVWRLDEDSDSLAVWFAGPPAERERRRADYLFHELRFDDKAEMLGGGKCLWGATAGHLCIADFYDVRYEFVFSGATLERWSLAYNVKGPQKDYDIRSDFRRHSPEM